MRISNKGYFICALTSLLVMLTGCGSGSSGSDPVNAVGRISLGISDGPIHDAKNVCIRFTEIEFKGEGAPLTVDLGGEEIINLLDFQGANSFPLLVDEPLPAGQYQWLRLGIDAERGGDLVGDGTQEGPCISGRSYLVTDRSTVHNLYVPSSAQTGLKLVGGFTIPVNGSANFTADFDLGKSLTEPPGLDTDVIFRPTIRLVNNVEVGTLTGLVDSALVATADTCAASVYVFPAAEGDVDPDNSITFAMVNTEENIDRGQTEYRYTVGFLLAGEYEAAFSCDDGATFEPVEGKPVSIIANEVTTVDFP